MVKYVSEPDASGVLEGVTKTASYVTDSTKLLTNVTDGWELFIRGKSCRYGGLVSFKVNVKAAQGTLHSQLGTQ